MIKLRILAAAVLAFAVSFSAKADKEPLTFQFEVEGVNVILRESVKGTVSARLFVKGGTANYFKPYEGIENIALNLPMQSGSADMTKESFNAACEKVGAAMGASSGYDYSNISLNCLNMYWDESWELFANAIVNPAFRQDEFELLREQMVTASRQNESNPDAHLNKMTMSNAWEGTNYEKFPSGSVESLSALNLEDTKAHFEKVVTKKNILLVVVGNISEADLREKIKTSLAKLPQGEKAPALFADDHVKEGLFVEDREIETNYIKGMFDAPKKGTQESVYNSLALSILGDRFFEELRTKRSLSYAPAAYSTGYSARPVNEIYISTTDPKASLEVMIDEVNKAKTTGFTEDELKGKKQKYLTGYYMGQETNSSISMSLGVAEINGGWKSVDNFTDNVLDAKVEDINAIMQEYGNTIYWSYLGKEELVQPEFFQQPVQPESLKK